MLAFSGCSSAEVGDATSPGTEPTTTSEPVPLQADAGGARPTQDTPNSAVVADHSTVPPKENSSLPDPCISTSETDCENDTAREAGTRAFDDLVDRVITDTNGRLVVDPATTAAMTQFEITGGWLLDLEQGQDPHGVLRVAHTEEGTSGDALLLTSGVWQDQVGRATIIHWLVHDVLQLPPAVPGEQIMGECSGPDGAVDVELIVLAETEPFVARPLRAWRANRATMAFEPTSIENVECTNESA